MNPAGNILEIRAGHVAALFPENIVRDVSDVQAISLIQNALEKAHASEVQIVQSLVSPEDERAARWLKSCGFTYLTDVLYLICGCSSFRLTNARNDLQFVTFDDSEVMHKRLSELILRTYEGSCDCPELNGLRKLDDALASYRAVGHYHPQRWFILRYENADVGCLLLNEYAAQREWEIVYMGIVPQFRGRNLGLQLIYHAQFLGSEAKIEQLSLAVDDANLPAKIIYRTTGFARRFKHRLFLRQI